MEACIRSMERASLCFPKETDKTARVTVTQKNSQVRPSNQVRGLQLVSMSDRAGNFCNANDTGCDLETELRVDGEAKERNHWHDTSGVL